MCTCGASEAKRHAAQHATRIFTAHAHLSASTFLLWLYVVSPHQLRSASTVLAHDDSSLLWCLAQHWPPVFFAVPLGCVVGFGRVHRQRAVSIKNQTPSIMTGPLSCYNFAHGRWQELLATRSTLTTSMLFASSKVERALVVTVNFAHGLWRELLATRSTQTTIMLCESSHVGTDTVMTISCCLAWILFCTCVWRRCPTLLTVVRKSYWPTETISTQACCVRLLRGEESLV